MEKIPVLILGGGVAGLSAALELARRSTASLVVERSGRLGGQVAGFCCKATESCARCGACRLGDLLAELRGRAEVSLWTRALAVGARRLEAGWEVELAPQAGEEEAGELGTPLVDKLTVRAGSVILAVGHSPFNPQRKSRFGFGRVPGVVTAADLEQRLARGQVPEARRLAFIQCVGSRDRSLGNLYCSRVCCGFALRLARLWRHLQPDTEITFFHMDVQGYGRAWEEELDQMRRDIRFVRSMPGQVSAGPGGPLVHFAEPDGSRRVEEFDLVALSQGLTPPLSAPALCEMFGVERGVDGFLGAGDDPWGAGAPGVFVAGAAQGPRSIVESMEHAGAAAAAAWAFVEADHAQG